MLWATKCERNKDDWKRMEGLENPVGRGGELQPKGKEVKG